MKQTKRHDIKLRDELILGLENEIRIQSELIAIQNETIKVLEKRNEELTEILNDMLQQAQPKD